MLDEDLLYQGVRLTIVVVVVTLANLTDLRQLSVAEDAAAVPESLEGVFGLARHHDVADESEEVALARRVREVTSLPEHSAYEFLTRAAVIAAESFLIVLQHPLVLADVRNMPAAEIPKANVLCLFLVILECLE